MDIEEDIKKVKELNNLLKFFKTHGWIPDLSREINTNGIIDAIDHILAEREEDKKKINKLEYRIEELKKCNKTISDRVVEYKKNCIPKQKVKEILNNRKERLLKGKKSYTNKIRINELNLISKLLEDK